MQKNLKHNSSQPQLNSIKERNKYLRILHEEVNKSRMAVETITGFKNTQMTYKRRIDQIQEDLHSCVLRINNESKKNVILKELITVIKGEMFNFQKTQKKQEEKSQSDSQKKIKKIQYDIEQILQKHNEEIAKITALKQSASSARSERVVFSNLFKKLEKQLKQNEQCYKENLIKSQVAKDKAPLSQQNSKKSEDTDNETDDTQKLSNSTYSAANVEILPTNVVSFTATGQTQSNAFLTLQNNSNSRIKNDLGSGFSSQIRKNQAHKKLTRAKNESVYSEYTDGNMQNTALNENIRTYENFLESIKIHIGCDSYSNLQGILQFYENIDLSNSTLSEQIDIYSNEIQRFENLLKQIKIKQSNSKCLEYQQQGGRDPINDTSSNGHSKQKHTLDISNTISDEIPLPEIIACLNSINEEFICSDSESDQKAEQNNEGLSGILNNEKLKKLDKKLDLLMQATSQHSMEIRNITDLPADLTAANAHRTTIATSESNVGAVDILLDKMQRFNECQKLLDKKLFKQEYKKQLGKNKRSMNRGNKK